MKDGLLVRTAQGKYALNLLYLLSLRESRRAIRNAVHTGKSKPENYWKQHFHIGSCENEVLYQLTNLVNYHGSEFVYPHIKTLVERCRKWEHPSRWSTEWVKTEKHYNRRQIFRALKNLELAGVVIRTEKNEHLGWTVIPHDTYTQMVGKVCVLKNHPDLNPVKRVMRRIP